TPGLDEELARWLQDEGPDALLMQWMSIDDRHPMLETPRVWTAVWRMFDCVAVEETWALLRRREASRFDIPAEAASISPGTGGVIEIPAHRGPLFLTLDGSPTFEGRLLQQLFRLPRLELRIETESGKT